MYNLDSLYQDLSHIGIRVSVQSPSRSKNLVDIELTLVRACYFVDLDGRILGLLFSWLSVHGKHVFADKFFKSYESSKNLMGESPWFSAICAFMVAQKDHRFKKGIKKISPVHHLGNRIQTSLVKLKGGVDYLEKIGIIVPVTALRIRIEDVLSVQELIKLHHQYRNRYIYGANWRSEIIYLIQLGAPNPNHVAKLLGIARSRVGEVFKEYSLISSYLKKSA